MRIFHWTSSSGKLCLRLTEEQVSTGHHRGDCRADVEAIRQDDPIASQTAEWDAEDLRYELKGYGAWDTEELADHEMNITRMVWIACGDCSDDPEVYAEEL